MGKLEWCFKQREGINLVEPNTNLAEAYLKKAEDSLESMRINKIKDWKISTAYYTMYFSLYAILMKVGIKCGIHSCTLEFAKYFLREYFNEEELDFLEDSLQARIDAQYYVNRKIADTQYQDMMKRAPEILVKCKSIVLKIDEKKIKEIRNKIIQHLKQGKAK